MGGAIMSYSYLLLLYQTIQAAHPFIPVAALGIVKRLKAGDVTGAEQRKAEFRANHGDVLADSLDTCILFLQMYGDDFLGDCKQI
jgi:hypothetical protein